MYKAQVSASGTGIRITRVSPRYSADLLRAGIGVVIRRDAPCNGHTLQAMTKVEPEDQTHGDEQDDHGVKGGQDNKEEKEHADVDVDEHDGHADKDEAADLDLHEDEDVDVNLLYPIVSMVYIADKRGEKPRGEETVGRRRFKCTLCDA